MNLNAGRVAGGTSSLNGMMYVRGSRHDYDHWTNDLGIQEWTYDDVLPYFKKLATCNIEDTDDKYRI